MRTWTEVKAALSMDRALLLGNGFSRSSWDKFGYAGLYEEVVTSLSGAAQTIFRSFDTKDFEQVLRAIDHAELVCGALGNAVEFEPTRENIRKALITGVLKVHPQRPAELSADWRNNATAFLREFPRIFTANYDLLPYWLLLDAGESSDGFGKQMGELCFLANFREKQRYHFLHGALHFYTEGAGQSVYKVAGEGRPLPEVVADAVKKGRYPLFVSEGTWKGKWQRIQANDYLRYVFEKLRATVGDVVVFGLGFWDNDQHIANTLKSAKGIKNLYIGIHGESAADQERLGKLFQNSDFGLSFFNTQGAL